MRAAAATTARRCSPPPGKGRKSYGTVLLLADLDTRVDESVTIADPRSDTRPVVQAVHQPCDALRASPEVSAVPIRRPVLALLPQRWRRAPRRWGHPLHSLCSYFAMFPPQLPNVFIRWLTTPGDVVYDPFSGRGTVALEAVLAGRRAFASDANPLAAALSAAKVRIPPRSRLRARITQLENRFAPPGLDEVPDHIRMLYSEATLRQLVFLKAKLVLARPVDAFLAATVLGLLHGNHSKSGATRALSISMPNTFAMARGYVRDYIATHRLEPPQLDVFSMLRRRLDQLDLPDAPVVGGEAWRQDATAPFPACLRKQKAKLVFTSPPYLQVIKYGKYNWVRLWFLGEEPKAVDERLIDTASLPRYRTFMRETLANLTSVVRDDGYVCLVIGDVRQRDEENVNLASDVWHEVARPDGGWRLHGVVTDRLPPGRKVSRIWKDSPGRATKIDRILILSRADGNAELPGLERVDWTQPVTWPTQPQGGRL